MEARDLFGTVGPSLASPLRKRMSASSWTCKKKIGAKAALVAAAWSKALFTICAHARKTMGLYISTHASLTLGKEALPTVQTSECQGSCLLRAAYRR